MLQACSRSLPRTVLPECAPRGLPLCVCAPGVCSQRAPLECSHFAPWVLPGKCSFGGPRDCLLPACSRGLPLTVPPDCAPRRRGRCSRGMASGVLPGHAPRVLPGSVPPGACSHCAPGVCSQRVPRSAPPMHLGWEPAPGPRDQVRDTIAACPQPHLLGYPSVSWVQTNEISPTQPDRGPKQAGPATLVSKGTFKMSGCGPLPLISK